VRLEGKLKRMLRDKLEKYKKMIGNPLIMIIKNIIGSNIVDFQKDIFKHKIIL
jgi:hypothetical protein